MRPLRNVIKRSVEKDCSAVFTDKMDFTNRRRAERGKADASEHRGLCRDPTATCLETAALRQITREKPGLRGTAGLGGQHGKLCGRPIKKKKKTRKLMKMAAPFYVSNGFTLHKRYHTHGPLEGARGVFVEVASQGVQLEVPAE